MCYTIKEVLLPEIEQQIGVILQLFSFFLLGKVKTKRVSDYSLPGQQKKKKKWKDRDF